MPIIFLLGIDLVVGSSVVIVIWSPDSIFFSVEVLYNLLLSGAEMHPMRLYFQETTILSCLNRFEGKLSPIPHTRS